MDVCKEWLFSSGYCGSESVFEIKRNKNLQIFMYIQSGISKELKTEILPFITELSLS